MALILFLFIMVILTEAFSAGLDTFRQLKAIGDMQERMRSVAIILRNDLKYDHFDEVRGNRLSDQDLRTQPPPDNGYFRIWQQSPHTIPPAPAPQPQGAPLYNVYLQGSIAEGMDGDQVPVARATQSWMAFTVHLHGTGPDKYLTGGLPTTGAEAPANQALQQNGPADLQQSYPNSMLSQWAEVAYFLRPVILAGNAQETANGTPLYALYRRQRLLARTNSATLQQPGSPGQQGSWPYYYNVSFPQPTNGPVQVNTPQSITVPTNRFGMDPSAPAGVASATPPPLPATDVWRLQDLLGGTTSPQSGDDLLLNDVISFDIKVLQEGGSYGNTSYDGKLVPVFVDLPAASLNRNITFQTLPPPQGPVSVFDTWTTQGPPNTYGAHWNDNPNPAGGATQAYLLPLKMRILALQITIRVWDEKTQRSRQVTIVQDM
jgi:hypothetical protein